MPPLTSLGVTTLKEGAGPAVRKANTVTCHAVGSVLSGDGSLKQFWSTRDQGSKPFTFQAGMGNVIKGWDEGVLGMKLGEVRNIKIPATMGYGSQGFPAWGIPANADLNFEIELLEVK